MLAKAKAKTENMKKLEALATPNNQRKLTKRKLSAISYKSLFGCSDTESDLSNSEDDEVVPRKLLRKSEDNVEGVKSKLSLLSTKYRKMKEDRDKTKIKYATLQRKYDEVLKLNFDLEKTVISYFKNKTTGETEMEKNWRLQKKKK